MVSYRDLAESDIEAALILCSSKMKNYNACAIHCRQCAEKYLKQMLSKLYMVLSPELSRDEFREVMNGHSLKRLMHFVGKALRIPASTRDDIVLLNEYYTNVSYPGEEYLEVSKETAESLLNSSLRVREFFINSLKEV